jgi:hypothetical protein
MSPRYSSAVMKMLVKQVDVTPVLFDRRSKEVSVSREQCRVELCLALDKAG